MRVVFSHWVFFAIIVIGAEACGSSRPLYKYQLQQVKKGDSLADDSRSIQKPLIFENGDFRISWSPGPLTFYFRIENKAKTDLQINFEKSFLISPGGNAFSAIHPGNSAIARGENSVIVPAQVGIDSWVRPGQKHGENHGGLVAGLSPGFDGGGFFPETGDAQELKKEYSGKTATVVLNISKAGKAENYRFMLQVSDITVEQ